MKEAIFIVFFLIGALNGLSKCEIRNPNQILDKIKGNHPKILIHLEQSNVLKESIEIAKQRPNPEVDGQSTVGDSIEGNVYNSSVSIKHVLELGGKRASRVQVAEEELNLGKTIARYESELVIIDAVLKLHRLKQIYQLIPVYEESLGAFNKIIQATNKRKSLSPEQQVEKETLELVVNDYKLKISQLASEKKFLNMHLLFFMGIEADCNILKEALSFRVNLDENFNSTRSKISYSKLESAKKVLNLAKANLKLEKANSYPDLKVGPLYEYEKINLSTTHTFGVAISIDLPILSLNRGGRAKAAREVIRSSVNLKNIEKESELDLKSWIEKYGHYKKSLKGIVNREALEKKHIKIESLFQRGIISTSLVIESHRQLIEFVNTRFSFEIGATEALWNIYKLKGDINNKKL